MNLMLGYADIGDLDGMLRTSRVWLSTLLASFLLIDAMGVLSSVLSPSRRLGCIETFTSHFACSVGECIFCARSETGSF
jgi:hypothetical protein